MAEAPPPAPEHTVGACPWPGSDPVYRAYHDTEWGIAVHDDRELFEKLALEGFQSGLSWLTVLRKRPAFRDVFAGFVPDTVAGFDTSDVERLLTDARIIRNRAKIEATITNAKVVLAITDELGSFDHFVWGFAPESHRRPRHLGEVPATTPDAVALAKALKKRGARFVGPTTAYAFMQAMGLVNDHLIGCPAGDALT